ncbi:MAG: APC family permease [Kineosporiaceae bacterium]
MPRTRVSTKRLVVGEALPSDSLDEQLLPKTLALPVFCSDPISSVAYATQEIIGVLALGGLALMHLSLPIAAAIALLLVVVVASYRQTCHAYPEGGGAYVVSRTNIGPTAGLVAASALLVDYVLTVAVSIVAGTEAITSYFPTLNRHKVLLALLFVALLTLVNLRGVKESGKGFAVPTYTFIGIVLVMFGWAGVRLVRGDTLTAVSAGYGVQPVHHAAGLMVAVLVLRAFASGCTALTGVEAISNGVPAFRRPKSRNAAATLVAMGVLAVTMFAGITVLAATTHVHRPEKAEHLIGAPEGWVQPTALAQIGHAVFGGGPLYALLQAATAGILVLAANTAYNGFPVLASILARDSYLPRQLHNRGDRLVFSNGIVALSGAAAVLVVAFRADTTRLIQLYIIGVFVSFTLSQIGMVRHWQRELTTTVLAPRARRRMRRSQAINAVGASVTAVVLVIVAATKLLTGAWIAVVAMIALFLVMKGIHGHYDRVHADTRWSTGDPRVLLPTRNHGVVLVSRLHLPTLRAVAYAKATRPTSLRALTVRVDADETDQLWDDWARADLDVPLVVVDSPYREIGRPVVEYLRDLRGKGERDVVTVFVPEYVVGRWWEHLLHNQTALRLKTRLLFMPGVMVTSVPWPLQDAVAPAAASEPTPAPAPAPAPSRTEAVSPASGPRAARGGGRLPMPAPQ